MLVREIMSTCIAECTEDAPLARVYELMQSCGHHAVVVVESKFHRVPLGIITEHTILEQVVGRGRSTKDLRAANVMTSRITKVSESSSVALCPAVTDSEGAGALIVVDENRDVCGILPRDILRMARADQTIHHSANPTAPSVDHAPLSGWTQ